MLEEKMIVADKVAEWLHEKEITTAFGIIGAGNVSLWDAIERKGKTQIICCHHEQAAVQAASSYFRVSGSLALALVTTGAGSANAITGVLAAYFDSIPVLVISGNETRDSLSADTRVKGVQGYDSTYLICHIVNAVERPISASLTLVHLEAAYLRALGKTGAARQGPVWVDIPRDVQTYDDA